MTALAIAGGVVAVILAVPKLLEFWADRAQDRGENPFE